MSGSRVNKPNEEWFIQQVRCGRLEASEDGRIKNTRTNNYIGAMGSGRYIKISLKDLEAGKIRHIQVHRLLFRIFKGEIQDGYEIDHQDNDRTNNSLSNLVAMTHRKNSQKAADDGLTYTFPVGNEFWRKAHASRKSNLGY